MNRPLQSFMQTTTNPRPVVNIVGSGIAPPGHLSLESVAALDGCAEVWTNVPEELHREMPASFAPALRSLRPFLLQDRPRFRNYEEIIAHIIERAKVTGVVGYLTQGNPIIFDSVTAGLLRDGRSHLIETRIYPAISSIDTLLVDVRYDPGKGLQIHEATAFVMNQTVVDPRCALLLLQPSVFGSRMPRLTINSGAPDLHNLVRALLCYYPASHPVQFVRSANGKLASHLFGSTIKQMCDLEADATLASTLFIPPLEVA